MPEVAQFGGCNSKHTQLATEAKCAIIDIDLKHIEAKHPAAGFNILVHLGINSSLV